MKYLKYLLILFIVPFLVLAEECDTSKITIKSIDQSAIKGRTEVIDDPEIKDKNIKLNLKMYDVGDSISYDVTIKNDSEEDYMIDEDTFKTNSDYIEYKLEIKDNNNVLKAKSIKELVLNIEYKKEVEIDFLNSNNTSFDASNSLKLSFNTKEKEKPLDVIVTDNIKGSKDPVKTSNEVAKEEKVDKSIIVNPLTSSTSPKIIIVILLTVVMISLIIINNKKKYNKYLILLLSISILPVVYAVCTSDMEVESNIEIGYSPTLNKTIIDLKYQGSSCITKYDGEVTDKVGVTETASKVYFDECEEKRNVIFGGFCWQVIRTTETGGTKLLYYGEPVDGKCEYYRGNHKGIVSDNNTEVVSETLDTEYLYGSSFTFDMTNNTFTLTNTEKATWSYSTYEDLIGKYTCKNITGTCTTLYNINSYKSNTEAYTASYKIGNTNYAQLGTTPYNGNNKSPAMVGYMFNKVYNIKEINPGRTEYKYGNSFTYDADTNTYTLSGETQIINNWLNGFNTVDNTHYTCWNTSGNCSTISYIQYTEDNRAYYFEISGGKSARDILEEMLSNNEVNRYNSNIKGILDAWYSQELLGKSDMLEDPVFCNARSIIEYGSWNPNGGKTTNIRNILFINNNPRKDLSCPNDLDQFSVANNKAKLTYPISLLQSEERKNINDKILMATGSYWWLLSPYANYGPFVDNRIMNTTGDNSGGLPVSYTHGIRPVISLKNNALIIFGTGSEIDPWIIE